MFPSIFGNTKTASHLFGMFGGDYNPKKLQIKNNTDHPVSFALKYSHRGCFLSTKMKDMGQIEKMGFWKYYIIMLWTWWRLSCFLIEKYNNIFSLLINTIINQHHCRIQSTKYLTLHCCLRLVQEIRTNTNLIVRTKRSHSCVDKNNFPFTITNIMNLYMRMKFR